MERAEVLQLFHGDLPTNKAEKVSLKLRKLVNRPLYDRAEQEYVV